MSIQDFDGVCAAVVASAAGLTASAAGPGVLRTGLVGFAAGKAGSWAHALAAPPSSRTATASHGRTLTRGASCVLIERLLMMMAFSAILPHPVGRHGPRGAGRPLLHVRLLPRPYSTARFVEQPLVVSLQQLLPHVR